MGGGNGGENIGVPPQVPAPARQAGDPHPAGEGRPGPRPPLLAGLLQGAAARLEAAPPLRRGAGGHGRVVPSAGARVAPPQVGRVQDVLPAAVRRPVRPARGVEEALMTRRVLLALTLLSLVPGAARGARWSREPRLHPQRIPAEPSYVRRVEPAIVGLRVRADEQAASSVRLGSHRFGTGVVFDPRGYAVTVSYVLLDALEIEAQLRDGRRVPARLAGLDLETGLGIVKLAGGGPWPAAGVGPSDGSRAGTPNRTLGADGGHDLVWVRRCIHRNPRRS